MRGSCAVIGVYVLDGTAIGLLDWQWVDGGSSVRNLGRIHIPFQYFTNSQVSSKADVRFAF